MNEPGLHVSLRLPFHQEAHRATEADTALWHQAALIMRVVNEMDAALSHDGEAHPAMHRIEAKLDLTLNLLAQALRGNHPIPPAADLTLAPEGLAWPADGTLKPGDSLLVSLHLSPALPLPVRMPLEVTDCTATRVHGHWRAATEDGLDAWGQWLFRQHRRAIQAAREGR